MIDNTDIVEKSILNFASPKTFYIVEALCRPKKDGASTLCGTTNNHTRMVRLWTFASLEEFHRHRDEIINICEANNARGYILPQRRSVYLVMKQIMRSALDNLEKDDINFNRFITSALCGCHEVADKSHKRWVIDIDADEPDTMEALKEFWRFTMKTPEGDAESLVRHRNRAGLTSDEKNDTMYSEKSFKEVGKALREEQTVNNPTERNTRLRPRGLGRQASSTRQSSGEQSTRQATASSARLQLTHPDSSMSVMFDMVPFGEFLVGKLRAALVPKYGSRNRLAQDFMPSLSCAYNDFDICFLPTPHGFHIVTPPFNREQKALQKYLGGDFIKQDWIKPDAMALLYAPNSIAH